MYMMIIKAPIILFFILILQITSKATDPTPRVIEDLVKSKQTGVKIKRVPGLEITTPNGFTLETVR